MGVNVSDVKRKNRKHLKRKAKMLTPGRKKVQCSIPSAFAKLWP